jgi:hypothetical protein
MANMHIIAYQRIAHSFMARHTELPASALRTAVSLFAIVAGATTGLQNRPSHNRVYVLFSDKGVKMTAIV